MTTTHDLHIERVSESIDARGMPTQTAAAVISTRCDLQQGVYELGRSDEGDRRRTATYAAYVPIHTDLQPVKVGDTVRATGRFDVVGTVEAIDFFSAVVYLR